MNETLRPKDYRFVLICILICAASLFVGIRYFHRAFPEASIDFRVNRDSSATQALKFLSTQAIQVSGYRHASSFRYDDETKIYLERELGLEKATALISSDVKLWRWGHRWFKPLQKEEVRAEITPSGGLASFFHALPEDAPGADLPGDAARGIAESFLVLEMKRPIDSLEFVDSQSEKRSHRTDHAFTWKLPAVNLGAASYRATVTVRGDRVDGYNEYVKIPEEWSRSYTQLRSLNESTTQVDLLFFALLGVGMLVTFGRRVRIKDINWKTSIAFGAICAVLQFLASLNELPLTEYNFDTTGSFGSFIGQTILLAALGALAFGGVIFVLTACAEPVYRRACPSHISISRMFSWQAIRTRSFFIASVAGITLTFFFFSYEIGFYLFANKLGAWAPAEVPYTDLLNTRFPWVFVLLGGFFPAVSEEWMFRAFSIPYLQGLLRRRWIAVILASFIWGFGHANYPNQPFFIRGLEVGVIGLILSWAMLRFGILAPLIAHYSIDAFYSAFLLLRSANPYLMASGAITAGINLIPLLLAVGAYVVTRRFASESQVTNEKEGSAPGAEPEPAVEELQPLVHYSALPRRATQAALAALIVALLLLPFRPPKFGESIQFRESAAQAADSARRFLSGLDFESSHYRVVTQPLNRVDPMAAQYVYSNAGIQGLNSMYGSQISPLAWQTRFFKPLQKEEFRVNAHPASGRILAFRHFLAEDATGADIPVAKAQEIAASFLSRQGYNLTQYELKETRSEKPKQRRDSTFVWEARDGTPGAIGESRLRLEAGVLGSKIGSWRQFVKIPEEWRRVRERRNLYSLSAVGIRTVFLASMFGLALLSLIRGTRQGLVRWKLAMGVAVIAMVLEFLRAVNSIPGVLFQYDTQIEMRVFVLTGVVGIAVLLIGIGLSAALASGLIMACYPDSPKLLRAATRRSWGRDAVVGAAATLGAFLILEWCSSEIEYHASRFARAPSLSIPDSVGSYLPIISNIRDVLFSALFFSAFLAFAVSLWTKTVNRWLRALVVAGLLISLLPVSAARLSEVALDAIPTVLLVMLAFLIVKIYLRDNYLAYFASTAVFSAARISYSLVGQGNRALMFQGWLLWALIMGGLALLLPHSRKTSVEDLTPPTAGFPQG